ncbi:redox protein, regulator of disulfide bond formation [Levilactobacillus paucivorans]|uniref:Redox protein, regulator of disulfide bond formation n=1 Tax=Levilactobacillus paucivorans TaxID=616990 RepID=A0A0R2LWL4_9LACO|nr:OsmC family protein [Levilactobacillus paucivorans]KRO03613.1 redox protein, regulator of disulfide bond formation [Levilactobacillus paucivorans]
MPTDREKFPPLYQTIAANDAGLEGNAYITDGGLDVLTSDPLNNQPGTNPEQLLGLALSTCLNATLAAIEKRDGLPHTSQVHTLVEFARDYRGFQFYLTAQVAIPGVDASTAQRMVDLAERRCPVAKLLAGNANVQIVLVDHINFTMPTA